MPSSSDSRRHGPCGGFTLIEVIVVLVIMALAYGLVVPALSSVLDGPRLDRAARQMVASLREARSTALIDGRTVRFTVDPASREWRHGDRRGALDDEIAFRLDAPPAGRGAGGAASILFFPDGGSTGGRLTLATGERRRLIAVDWLTGRVWQIAQ